jgi:predicted phosphodiesterase
LKKPTLKHRAVVIPDQHFPIADRKAINVALKIIEKVKPDRFINLGDVLENEEVSAWKYKGKALPSLEFQLPQIDSMLKPCNKWIDEFDDVLEWIDCKDKWILAGNHDEWLDNFVNSKVGSHPVLKEYTFRKACRWDERGYKYLPYNKPLRLGKLAFIHGAYATKYSASKHLEAYGSNIIFGHTHSIERHTLTKLEGGTIGAWSMGALKSKKAEDNKWLRGRLHTWSHCVGIVDWFSNGNFKVEQVEIVDGTTSLWGEMIYG